MAFPPLYECSVCGEPVTVKTDGAETLLIHRCPHTTATVWANRKVTLRGKGVLEGMPLIQRGMIKLTLTLRQFLSILTGRSI